MSYLTLALGLLSVVSIYLIKNYFTISPSVPGPALARFTDFWRAWKQYNGQLRSELVKLHQQHGAVVRYGINSISISDPAAIDVIYGSRVGFITADSYLVLLGISNGKEVSSLVSTRDEVRHGQMRRSVAGAFSPVGAKEYEPYVDQIISELLNYIDRKAGGEIDLTHMMVLYSMDSATKTTFSESLGCLQADRDADGSIQLIRDRFYHWGWWSSVPWLERLVYRNPWAMRRSIGKTPGAMVRVAVEKLQERLKDKEKLNQGGNDLLNKFIGSHHSNPGVLDRQGIVGLVMSTISGAGDTTATTMTATMFYLLKHPPKLAKLHAELTQAGVQKDVLPPYAITGTLPYLAAVIKETMRVYPVTTWPTERLVPAGGIFLKGDIKIPEGTSVGIHIPAVHLDEDVYGNDVTTWRPERWIEANEEEAKNMEKTFMGFSRGRRVCLGQHVALMQMKKVLPMLVVKYDMSLVHPDAELEADMSGAVACLKPLLVRAKPYV